MPQIVDSIMSTPVVSVEMDDKLSLVNSLFEKTRFHHLVVVDNKQLVGIISDRDLFKALTPTVGTAAETSADLAILNKKAHQIMSRDPVHLKQKDDIKKAVIAFREHKVSCLPVVNERQVPVGILSWRDIIKALDISLQPE
ncbi:MAG TPA: CBS domain-containing protein [Gammaproteobacteria bacterium]